MATKANLETSTEVVLSTAVSTLAFPTLVTDGQDVSLELFATASAGTWKTGKSGHVDAIIFVESSAAMTLSGGVGLYGWRTDRLKWYLLGALNSGVAIATLGATTGAAYEVALAGVFDRLAVGPLTSSAVTPSTGTVTFRACQVRQMEDRP